MSSGKPVSDAAAATCSSVIPAALKPGTVGTPEDSTCCFARILSPMTSSARCSGPMKTMPRSARARAKATFSERKP